MSYTDQIKDVIESSDVALFMKGTPSFIMCGNSDRALQALRRAGAPVTTVDILPDPQIRQDLSAISGSYSVFVLVLCGELAATLRAKLGDDFAATRDENTVALAS